MTKFLPSAAIAGLLMSPVFAMSAGASEVDANGDGLLTIDEVQAVYAEITSEDFSAMDANADGALDADEVAAAQDAGLMQPKEG